MEVDGGLPLDLCRSPRLALTDHDATHRSGMLPWSEFVQSLDGHRKHPESCGGLAKRSRIARAYSKVKTRDIHSYFKVMTSMLSSERRAWAERLTKLDDPTEVV